METTSIKMSHGNDINKDVTWKQHQQMMSHGNDINKDVTSKQHQ